MSDEYELLFITIVSIALLFIRLYVSARIKQSIPTGSGNGVLKFRYWLRNHEARTKRKINQRNSFYTSLNQKQRREFIWRIFYFLNTTEFVIKFPGDAEKIKMTISYVAAQISYALPIESFDLYHKVIVYEDDYYSQINQTYHKGEVNPGVGIMVFSWNAIQFGLSENNNGVNLLLHEFAHALRLEHKLMSYNIFDEEHFDQLDRMLRTEFENLLDNDSTLFRNYAKTNIEEFFAVASETFFERPVTLKAQMPAFYQAFQNLYRQDPAGRESQT
jgi:Mlc titration factor MtfA (ptsG expression regulator)